MRGNPRDMQSEPSYRDVSREVLDHLRARAHACLKAGIEGHKILIDPGIGFGKRDEHNLELTRSVGTLANITGCRVLYGASRKSLIGRIAGIEGPKDRLPGSLALAGVAAAAGASMLRVHDVAETVQYLRLRRALRGRPGEKA